VSIERVLPRRLEIVMLIPFTVEPTMDDAATTEFNVRVLPTSVET
jgi:hypothetical protein